MKDEALDQILYELEQAESMGIDEEMERSLSIFEGGVITLFFVLLLHISEMPLWRYPADFPI